MRGAVPPTGFENLLYWRHDRFDELMRECYAGRHYYLEPAEISCIEVLSNTRAAKAAVCLFLFTRWFES